MITNRHTRLASPGARPGDDDALARLLADAAPAPGCDRELRGETDAVAAFREARRVPSSLSRKRPVRAGKLLVIKSVIVVAGLSGGGVAFAAVTGHLPGRPADRPAAPSSVAPSVSPHAAATEGSRSRTGAKVRAGTASPASPAGKLTMSPAGQPASQPSGGTPAAHPAAQPTALPAVQPAGAPDVGVGASAGPVRLPGAAASLPVSASLSPAVKPTLPAGVP